MYDYVVNELNKINGVFCKETDGTFYVFPSFEKYIQKSKPMKKKEKYKRFTKESVDLTRTVHAA